MPSPLRRQTPMPQSPMGQSNPQMQAGPDSPMQRMIFNMLYQRNPQFRQIADSVRGMTPEQACQSLGVDMDQYNQMQNINPNQIRQMFGL